MHITSRAVRRLGLAAVTVILGAGTGCGLDKQSAPPLAGPSEFALSITLTATPDAIVQDGVSQSVIQILARDPEGQPVRGVTLQMSATTSSALIREVTFTESTVVTDASGQATLGVVAPPAPATRPSVEPILYVSATPSGVDFANASARPVQVRLITPPGTPLDNQNPVAAITANPRVANFNETIQFDAGLTTDEGQPCRDRCQYIWEFGDNTIAVRGMTAEHVFPLPGNYTVTLTVTDDRGGVDTETVDLRIIGPTPPTATFTVTPLSPVVNTQATFNASGSTVGVGATITNYAWSFGDGSPTVSSNSATATKTYTTAGSYLVTLTITDSLGRTATDSATVTVQ